MQRLSFETVFSDESGGNTKTPQSEYQASGLYPIIDQGKELIGGYTDDASRICGKGKPAIIFGDHTRILKYADFPFCMGADGVKILRPKIEADLKYLYHQLKSLHLPSAGYDRHFKYLKRTEVALPSIEEQRRIAAILDQADALRAKRREALAELDGLAQAIFVETFGDPILNPKLLDKKELSAISKIGSGSTPNRAEPDFFGGSIPWVKTTEVVGDTIIDTEEKLTDSGLKAIRGKLYPSDSIIVAMYGQGQTRGRCGLLGIQASCNQACGVIQPSPSFLPTFMFHQLRIAYERLRALGRGGNQENLNLQLLGAFEVLVPPLTEQKIFSAKIQALESLKATHRTALTELDALFASLQHRAFRGEL